jgi:Calx-beta domain
MGHSSLPIPQRANALRRRLHCLALEDRIAPAIAGFNDATGVNSNGTADNPYQLNAPLVGAGAGEPEWSNTWQLGTGFVGTAVVQSAITYEGDGALHVANNTNGIGRHWAPALTSGVLSVSQMIYIPPNGGVQEYIQGPGATTAAATAAQWYAFPNGNFQVIDGPNYEDTGIAVPINTWTKVSLLIELASQTYDFFINDVQFNAPDPLGFRGDPPNLDTVALLLQDPAGYYLDDLDIHAISSIQFSASTYEVFEKGEPTLQIPVARTGSSVGAVSVAYTTSDDTAVAGTNYAFTSGTLNWADGDTADKFISVPILDNHVFGSGSSFKVTLTSSNPPAALGSQVTATVNIIEPAGLSLSAAGYPVTVFDGNAFITVHRQFDDHGPVSVHYATSDGSAKDPVDYTATSGDFEWAGGVTDDQTFAIPIINDAKSDGTKSFKITLSNATGNADIGPQSTATITIAKHHGLSSGTTFTDADGDLVTVTLLGGFGTITFYLSDGIGPISEIDTAGTDSSKSVVNVAVKKLKGGATDGRVAIGEIDGTGVKTISAPKGDLVGTGINLTTFLGSLSIGAISNSADITVAGIAPTATSATRITAGVISDGTNINILDAPLGSLTATSIGIGSIAAPSVGTILVKGKRQTSTAFAIPGDFKSNLTVAGTGVPAGKPALKSLKVAGAVTGSTIRVGITGTVADVGRVSVGSFVNSHLFAGYSGPDNGSGSFNLPSTVSSFIVAGKKDAFDNSYVLATNFLSVQLASVKTDNGKTKFGFLADNAIRKLTIKNPAFKYVTGGSITQGELDFEAYIV